MDYINKMSSLEEMSSAQVAINLCQDSNFKEVALLLEKPIYGMFVTPMTHRMAFRTADNQTGAKAIFVSDPKQLSIWAKIDKKDLGSVDAFARSCCSRDEEKSRLWCAAIGEQCQRLVERIPSILRQGVRVWMDRIALEYLSYSRRMEVLFDVSRYFLMNVLNRDDWTKAGRLDEKRLALRLLRDERLTVLQRYRVACLYCLHVHITRLWVRLTEEEKQFTTWKYGPGPCKETHDLVLLWSCHMRRQQEEEAELRTNCPWLVPFHHAMRKTTFYGNQAGLMLCWESLKEIVVPHLIIFDMALLSLQKWQSVPKRHACGSYKEILVSNKPLVDLSAVENFNLPSYYSKLMCFFLSHMDDEHQLTFFKEAFQSSYTNKILECFLDWPHCDEFLPTINRLWGITPKDKYAQCLLALVNKYSEKEECHYDYRSMLRMLWEITPEEYKQHVFSNYDSTDYDYLRPNIGEELLSGLSEKYPFQEKDESLFKCFLRDLPQEGRSALMRSKVGKHICLQLVRKEKWSFGNWFLDACLPKEEIPSFKEQFVHSAYVFNFCVDELKQNREKLLEDVIDWSLDSEPEKEQFRCALINESYDLNTWEDLLCGGEFAEMDRIINFLTSSDQKKKLYRWHFSSYTCRLLVERRAVENIDAILNWCLDREEEIRELKKHIFEYKGMCSF